MPANTGPTPTPLDSTELGSTLFDPALLDQAQPFELHGARFHPLSSPSRGGTELALWQLHLKPGSTGVPHTIDREEVFIGLAGELLIMVDGEQTRLAPGVVLSVPAGSLLSAGTGAREARVLVCTRAGLSAVLADGTVLHPAWAA